MAEVPEHHPFRELRHREHITLLFVDEAELTGGAFYARRGDRAVIGLARSLDAVHRRCGVGHEIGHDELGDNETAVRRFVARWLVPHDELKAMYDVAVANELPVEVWMVAERFDVTEDVAELAMRMLLAELAA